MPQMHFSDNLWLMVEIFLLYGTACLAVIGVYVVLSALMAEIRGKKKPR
jgi:hypothetical protein